jgi:hypothetical protein
MFGKIVCALDRNRYKVAWDDGNTSDYYSDHLSKEAAFASLSLDAQPPRLILRTGLNSQLFSPAAQVPIMISNIAEISS